MPEIFMKFSEQIFELEFTEQPSFINLISILMQMNSSYFEFGWNSFIKDHKVHQQALKLMNKFEEWKCENPEHSNFMEKYVYRPPEVVKINEEEVLYKGQWVLDKLNNQFLVQGHGLVIRKNGDIFTGHI